MFVDKNLTSFISANTMENPRENPDLPSTMKEKCDKIRARNMSYPEKRSFVKILQRHITVLDGNGVSKLQKEKAWIEIMEEFNEVADIKRDLKQIRAAYTNLKRRRSKSDAKFMKQIHENSTFDTLDIKDFGKVAKRGRRTSGDSTSEDNSPYHSDECSEVSFPIPPGTLSVQLQQENYCVDPLSECEDTSGYNSNSVANNFNTPSSSSQIYNNGSEVDLLRKQYYERKLELAEFELHCKKEIHQRDMECKALQLKLIRAQLEQQLVANKSIGS